MTLPKINLAGDWRLIQTAPGGKTIIEVAILGDDASPIANDCGDPTVGVCYRGDWFKATFPFQPTHWRPLTAEMRAAIESLRPLITSDGYRA